MVTRLKQDHPCKKPFYNHNNLTTFLGTQKEGKHLALVSYLIKPKRSFGSIWFHRHCCSCLKNISRKSWNLFKVKLQGCKANHMTTCNKSVVFMPCMLLPYKIYKDMKYLPESLLEHAHLCFPPSLQQSIQSEPHSTSNSSTPAPRWDQCSTPSLYQIISSLPVLRSTHPASRILPLARNLFGIRLHSFALSGWKINKVKVPRTRNFLR